MATLPTKAAPLARSLSVTLDPLPLDRAPEDFRIFRDKQDECVKVVLKPFAA